MKFLAKSAWRTASFSRTGPPVPLFILITYLRDSSQEDEPDSEEEQKTNPFDGTSGGRGKQGEGGDGRESSDSWVRNRRTVW